MLAFKNLQNFLVSCRSLCEKLNINLEKLILFTLIEIVHAHTNLQMQDSKTVPLFHIEICYFMLNN